MSPRATHPAFCSTSAATLPLRIGAARWCGAQVAVLEIACQTSRVSRLVSEATLVPSRIIIHKYGNFSVSRMAIRSPLLLVIAARGSRLRPWAEERRHKERHRRTPRPLQPRGMRQLPGQSGSSRDSARADGARRRWCRAASRSPFRPTRRSTAATPGHGHCAAATRRAARTRRARSPRRGPESRRARRRKAGPRLARPAYRQGGELLGARCRAARRHDSGGVPMQHRDRLLDRAEAAKARFKFRIGRHRPWHRPWHRPLLSPAGYRRVATADRSRAPRPRAKTR